jgi:hypothetical protein
MGKRPHVLTEAGERESRHVQLLPCSQPYLFFHILQSYEFVLTFAVSSDAAIAIAFGLISISISLLGVWISYLTLRATSLDSSTNLIFLHLFSCVSFAPKRTHTHYLFKLTAKN